MGGQATKQASQDELVKPISPALVVVALVGTAAVAAGAALPLVRVGLGREVETYTGLDVRVLGGMLAVSALVLLLTVLLAVRDNREGPRVASAAGAVVFVMLVAMLFLVESVAALVPTGWLPESARRFTFDLAAGSGMWLAAGGAFTVALSMFPRPSIVWLGRPRSLRLRASREFGLLAALGLVLLLAIWLRYRPWIDAAGAGESVRLVGWSLPWIGPGTLAAVWTLAAGLVAGMLDRQLIAGLLAATGGWLLSFLAALAVLSTEALGRIRIEDLARENLNGVSPSVDLAPAVWGMFGVGIAAAGAGAALIWRPPLQTDPGVGLDEGFMEGGAW